MCAVWVCVYFDHYLCEDPGFRPLMGMLWMFFLHSPLKAGVRHSGVMVKTSMVRIQKHRDTHVCVCVRTCVSTPTGPLPVVVVHVQLIPVLPFVVP